MDGFKLITHMKDIYPQCLFRSSEKLRRQLLTSSYSACIVTQFCGDFMKCCIFVFVWNAHYIVGPRNKGEWMPGK